MALLAIGAAVLGVAQSPSRPQTAAASSPTSAGVPANATTVPSTSTGEVPSGTSLMDLSWVGPADAFALSRQPCAVGTCPVVARTTDGGDHWRELPATPARITSTTGCTILQCVNGISGIAFASSAVGYLYGPSMFMTTDGGQTWQPVTGPKVAALAVGRGQVFRVVFPHGGCPGVCAPSLQVAPVGSTAWRTVLGPLSVATATTYQILASASDVYLVVYGDLAAGAGTQRALLYRSTDGGATFEDLADPCLGRLPTQYVLTALAAAPGGVLEGLCTPRDTVSGRQYLVASINAGSSWQPLRPLPSGTFGVISAASASTIAVATGPVGGSGTRTAKLLVTADGGKSWKTAATDTFQPKTLAVAQLGFVTAQVGWWLADGHRVFVTTDGGTRWSTERYPSAIASPTHTLELSVNPSRHLTDGETVQVSVTGFAGGGKFWISECASAADANAAGCGQQLAAQPFGVTDTSGTGSRGFTVTSTAPTSPYDTSSTRPCTDECVIVATMGVSYPFADAPITFAGG